MSDDDLRVTIEFRRRGETEWSVRELSLEEYFDPIDSYTRVYSKDHPYSIDSVPKYFHAIEYLGEDPGPIDGTRLTITDLHRNQTLVESETFDNERHRRLIARKIDGDQGPSWSFVIEMIHDADPRVSQIIKFELHDDVPHSCSRVVIRENDDGTETLVRDD